MKNPRDISNHNNHHNINHNINHNDHQRVDEVSRIIQVNLCEVRCAECKALLAQASKNSVVCIVCPRCKSFNVTQIKE